MRSLTRPNENEWMDEWNIWRWFILPLFFSSFSFLFRCFPVLCSKRSDELRRSPSDTYILCRLLNWTEEIDYSNVRRPLTFSTIILSFNQFHLTGIYCFIISKATWSIDIWQHFSLNSYFGVGCYHCTHLNYFYREFIVFCVWKIDSSFTHYYTYRMYLMNGVQITTFFLFVLLSQLIV